MWTKKAFSVLEIVFIIVIIAVISSIAIPKLFQNKLQTHIVKTKSDIALIRKAIKDDLNYQVMHQLSDQYIEKLDNAIANDEGRELFSGVDDRALLQYPLISTDTIKNEEGRWIKLSDSEYKIVLDKQTWVVFTYDNEKGSFECDKEEEHCMELLQ